MNRRAFTLIELLVVIAIIAILAAILFPVFAQAKASAKRTASLSNIKQTSLGFIMYGADADDMIPTMVNGPLGNLQNWPDGHVPQRTDSWVITTNPYRKNYALLVDPLRGDAGRVFSSNPTDDPNQVLANSYRRANRFPMYGINYIFLSPLKCIDSGCSDFAGLEARSFTQASEPAGTVFLTSSQRFTLGADLGFFGVNAPGMWAPLSPADVPYIVYWDGTTGSGDWHLKDKITSSAYFDTNKRTNIAWLDGHAKAMTDTQLADGTNAAQCDKNTDPSITDKTKYLWNLDDNYYGG
jgi:prepilin-type N-terminal cleavage/methylation domain-containing protein/prepilin-type processing-associated H-X9-DG protein